jgi:hypothetical protein
MTTERWAAVARIVLSGAIAGVVWFLVSATLLALFAGDLLAAVERSGQPAVGGVFFFAVDLAMGVWAVWIYAAIRAGTRSRRGAVLATALAWWSMKTLESAKWVGLGLIPVAVVPGPLATSLVSALLATAAGTLLYERVTLPAAAPPAPR